MTEFVNFNPTAYVDGRLAYYGEVSWMDCPFPPEEAKKYVSWHQGWADAEQEDLRSPYEQGT